MADLIPPMLIKLQADVNDLKVGLAKAESAMKGVDDSVKKASTGMTNFMSKIKQVGATMGVAFASQQVVQFGKDIVMAASDMNETMSKTAVIFGEGFDKVNQFAEGSANAMGMSKKAALDASSTFALFGKSAGLAGEDLGAFSGDLVKLSADFASFYNTSPEDAITAIGAALRGESEPIRRYNVLINEASLKQEAMRMGLIKTTEGALSPQVRVLAAHALILNQSKDAQGDFARTADGAANTMRILSANMENAKAKLGAGLLPAFQALLTIMKPLIAGLAAFGTFLANNSESVTAFIVTVTALSAAWGVYTLVVKRAAIQQAILNGLQAINPMAAIVIAVGLLVAAMVKLWNSNENFRKAVVAVAKVALTAFASIIPMIGQVFEAIMKINTGPLRLLLMALSHLPGVGKYAKSGLDLMNKGIDNISNFADSAAKKAKELADKLDKVAASAGKAAAKTKDAVKGGTDGGTGGGTGGGTTGGSAASAADKAKKKLEGYEKDVLNIYQDMNDVIAEAQDKVLEVTEKRNEDLFKAHKNYDEKVLDLKKTYGEALAEADKRYGEAVANAQNTRDKAETQAHKRHKEQLDAINKDYTKKTVELEKNLTDKLDDIRKKAAIKSEELTKSAADKQASIVVQSMNRLKDAFASKVGEGFNVGKLFEKGMSADALLSKLKDNLAQAKNLAEKAAFLQANGFSQTFIEQVMAAGPESGNALADSILNSTPETIAELKKTFNEAEKTANHGVDDIAKVMNSGGQLATEELMNSFNQVSVDLKQSLATVSTEMEAALADAQRAYEEAMTDAASVRDERIADSNAALMDALATAKEAYDEAIADAEKALKEAREEADKNLKEGLAEATKTLQDALAEAQKDYEKAIDDINKATDKKLADLKQKLAEVAAQMAMLGTAQASAAAVAALANAPVYTPYVPIPPTVYTPGGTETLTKTGSTNTGSTTNNNITVTGVNLADPYATTTSVVNALKFGNVVVPVAPSKLAAGESGAIGAASIKSRTITLTSPTTTAKRGSSGGGFGGAVLD